VDLLPCRSFRSNGTAVCAWTGGVGDLDAQAFEDVIGVVDSYQLNLPFATAVLVTHVRWVLGVHLDIWSARKDSVMRVGYIRVSTLDQNTIRQLDRIEVERTFTDKASARVDPAGRDSPGPPDRT
jgi:hypothetical protein